MLRVREPRHRLVRTPGRDVHVHVYEKDDPAVHEYLLLRDHLRWTDSTVAAALLEDLEAAYARFTLVLPRDYQRVLDVRAQAETEGLDLEGDEVWDRIMEASRG